MALARPQILVIDTAGHNIYKASHWASLGLGADLKTFKKPYKS